MKKLTLEEALKTTKGEEVIFLPKSARDYDVSLITHMSRITGLERGRTYIVSGRADLVNDDSKILDVRFLLEGVKNIALPYGRNGISYSWFYRKT